VGQERYYLWAGEGVLFLNEQPARMLPVRTTIFENGDGAGNAAERRSALTVGGGCPYAS